MIHELNTYVGEITELRHRLHRCPELGNNEVQTSKIVEEYLQNCGIETSRPFGTAVVGTLRGALDGPTVALRADMDALPMAEQTGVEFASENQGIMHACGHDVHMAAVLAVAKVLSLRRETLGGTVKFLFQPDEEGDGGAQRMVEHGCLDGVEAVFGAHVDPTIPVESVGVRYGKFYAAADKFDITVTGKSSHGATPQLGIDALRCGAELACKLAGYDEDYVLTVGTFHSGTVRNILNDKAELAGILRTLGPAKREEMKQFILSAAWQLEQTYGTAIDVRLTEGYPGIVNEDGMTALAERAAEACFGAERVIPIEKTTMTTEDFGYYLDKVPGCFYHIGTGGNFPLHNSCFLPADEAVFTAAEMHLAVIERFLHIK